LGTLRLAGAPARSAATWTTRNCVPGPHSICRSSVEGALFFAGDGHAVQGDGEVCITALETGVTGSFRLTVRKDMELNWPFAERASHVMSIGLDEDLDDAAKQAVREMVKHVCARTNLTRNEAYMLCSLAGNLRVTQLVDGNKGIHMLLPKACL
jgi:acetamidase/formamidase